MIIDNEKHFSDVLRSLYGEKKNVDLAKKSNISTTTLLYWKRGIHLNFLQCYKLAVGMGLNMTIELNPEKDD
jgi:hypothetical protein